MRRYAEHILLVVLAACVLGWLDPSATPREASRLYQEGKFDDAAAKYNQALVDEPDSALLHFNLGDAEYRRKQYEASVRAFASLPQDAAAQYNQGNALYQMGLAAEQAKPQDALQKWAEALVAYRRAIATDPADEDAKFNYEWVSRKIEELKKKLEEQQQQQQDQQQQNQQDQSDQDQRKQDRQADQQQPQDQQQEQDKRKQDEQPQEAEQPEQKQDEQAQKPEQGQDEQQAQQDQQPSGEQPAQGEGEPQPAEGELSRDEATALLDGERNEELRPDEVIRRQLGAGEGPVQDW